MSVDPARPDDPGRRIPLRGSFNFRDLGGYPAAEGRALAGGRLFRSDGLAHLDEESRARLKGLGLRTDIDLRESRESAGHPDAIEGLGITYRHIPALGDQYYPNDANAPLARRSTGVEHLGEIYELLLTEFGGQLVRAVEALAEDGAAPALVHCSAGKDRTGIVIALTLDLLGVPDEWIFDDYAATEEFLGTEFLAALQQRFAEAGIAADVEETATRAPRELIVRALEGVRARHGSVEQFLLSEGMDPGTPERLRRNYLA